jgi:hypothetical protein
VRFENGEGCGFVVCHGCKEAGIYPTIRLLYDMIFNIHPSFLK